MDLGPQLGYTPRVNWMPDVLVFLLCAPGAGGQSGPGVLAFRPLEPVVHTEDFLSVTSAGPASCLLLDATGALVFSPDGGRTLVPRARHPGIDMVQIRFSGLLTGWAIDRHGRLWRTRDSGRTFQPQPLPEGRPARRLLRAATGRGTILLRDDRGELHHLSGARIRSEPPAHEFHPLSPPSPTRHTSSRQADPVLFLDEGRALAGGLDFLQSRRTVPRSATGSTDAQDPRDHVEGDTKDGDRSGKRDSGNLGDGWQLVDDRGWTDAASCGRGVVLVGDGGRVARVVVGSGGTIEVANLHTERADVTDLVVLDRLHLWVAYADGTLRVSADGGRSWVDLGRQRAEGGPIRLAFITPRTGFMLAGAHRLLATADGGRSWTERACWPDLQLHDLFFHDTRRGWLVGGKGSVLHTSDGGSTWTSTRLAPGHDLHRVRFVDARRGWVAGAGGSVYRSTDGGRSWNQVFSGQATLLSMHFTRSGHGWVGGDDGVILHTTDGGDHWTPRSIEVTGAFRSMSFVDRTRGLAADGNGTLAVTRDAGHSWRTLTIATDRLPTVVACDPATARCLVGGQSGLLLAGDPFRYLP